MSEKNNQGCQMVGMLDIKGQDQCRRVYSVDGISPTLTTSGGGQREVKIFDTKRLRVRKLTPKEYGILQAFPMETWNQVVSDSQAYKQFGNAVTTTVFTAIAEEIAKSIYQAESEELNMTENTENKSFEGMNPPEEENTAAVENAELAQEEKNETAAVETEEYKAPEYKTPDELADGLTKDLYANGFIAKANYSEIQNQMAYILARYYYGTKIGKETETNRDWTAAENAINDILAKYTPDGYMGKIIYPVLIPLKERMEAGERTPELFNAIVEATR